MKRDDEVSWSRLGRIEKLFLVLMAIWALLYFTGMGQKYQMATALSAIFMGVLAIVKIGRMAVRNVIWRLRNRLIVAYLFIAVVPIVLILALMLGTSYAVVGQVAVFLVNRQLENHIRTLRLSGGDDDARAGAGSADGNEPVAARLRREFPSFEMLVTGDQEFRYPRELQAHVAARAVEEYDRPDHEEGRETANVCTRGRTPSRAETKSRSWRRSRTTCWSSLVPGIGDVNFIGYTERAAKSQVPPAVNALDSAVSYLYPVFVPSWENPQAPPKRLLFVVDTRFSAVLGIVFGQKARLERTGDDLPAGADRACSCWWRLVSLLAGVQLTRSHHGRGPRALRRHAAREGGRFLLSDSGEGQRSVGGTERVVQHDDGEPGPADRRGQGEGAAGIGTGDRPRGAESALPQGRAVHEDAGAERRLQPGAHGVGRLLRFHGAARTTRWRSRSAMWRARESRRRC